MMGRVSVPSSLSELTVAPAALSPLSKAAELACSLEARVAANPNDAEALAQLANLRTREARYAEAMELYERAAQFAPPFPEALLAAADLAHMLRDESHARDLLARALETKRYFPDPAAKARDLRVVLLMRDAPYSVNAPLELLLDRDAVAIDKCFVQGFDGELPARCVALTAFGWWEGAGAAIRAASRFSPINDPQRLIRVSRPALAETLRACCGARAVPSQTIDAAAAERIDVPALVRPTQTQAGRGLALVESTAHLREHVTRFPAPAYDVCPFVDYRSSDGLYRKYRIVLIDGVLYPYHLAISPRWIVHYQTSPMREHAWMREEELAFLQTPGRFFERWNELGSQLAEAIGLDFVGFDVTRLSDGTMLVFEADPTMLLHDEDEADVFAYKRPHVARLRAALTALIASRRPVHSAWKRTFRDEPAVGTDNPAQTGQGR